MNSNIFFVKLRDKSIVFLRTHTGRIYDITGCQPIADNEFGLNFNGALRNANLVLPEFVDNLLAAYPDDFKHVQIKASNQKPARTKAKDRTISKRPITTKEVIN